MYKLKHIDERQSYRVRVSAPGYQDSVLEIDGWAFSARKESRYVFLKKDTRIAAARTRVIMGGVSSMNGEPLYIVDEKMASKKLVDNLLPDEIESIEVLKDAAALALYGAAAKAGVVLIATKKPVIARQPGAGSIAGKNEFPENAKLLSNAIADVKIAPNPVKRGTGFTFSFTADQNGSYTLNISNIGGTIVESRKIMVTQKKHALLVQVPVHWAGGLYHITIMDQKNTVVHAGSFLID